MQDYKILKTACKALSSVCDYANTLDGQGFNGVDAEFGHSLAEKTEWTPKMYVSAQKMLKKYTKQLQGLGVVISNLKPLKVEMLKTEVKPKPKSESKGSITFGNSNINKPAFIISFNYNPEIVNRIKQLPKRFFDYPSKTWFVYANGNKSEIWEKLNELAKEFDLEMKVEKPVPEIKVENEVNYSNIGKGLNGTLRPFQIDGVRFALKEKRVLIADEMGLGKTIEAIATVSALDAFPVLVVSPATLKYNWKNEWSKWTGRSVKVMQGSERCSVSEDITIINYDILMKHDYLKNAGFKSIIFDESHYLKNHKAKRSKSAADLAKNIPVILMLTGTPILNRPIELVNQLIILNKLNKFGGFWNFAKEYCGAYQTSFGWDMSGATNLDSLKQKMTESCLIRRKKEDVLKDLPEKQRTVIPIQIDNEKEYGLAEDNFIEWLKTVGKEIKLGAEHLSKIEYLKQLSVNGKMKSITEWIISFINTGEKLVVFAHHKKIQHDLLNQFPNSARIFSEDSPEKRSENVDRFQNDPNCNLIILSQKAANVGITLTASSTVLFTELGWTPADHDQAEDRCHRIGQKNLVNIYYMIGKNTIEESVMDMLDSKRTIIDKAIDGKNTKETSLLGELIKKYSN